LSLEFLLVEDRSYQIGARLKAAREHAGLAMEDVRHVTRIPISVIAALEAEDFSVFSSPTYARSFLSQYSQFVGVDATPWLDSIEPVTFVSEEVVAPLFESRFVASSPEPAPPYPPRNGALAAALVTAVTALMVVIAVKGYRLYDARFASEPARDAAPTAVESRDDRIPPVPLVAPVPRAAPVGEDEEDAPPRAILVTEY
jgi:cytoskeletal protein RodZ